VLWQKGMLLYASVTLQQLQGDHLEAASWMEKITSIEKDIIK